MYAIVQIAYNDKYSVRGYLEHDLDVAKKLYANLLLSFMKHMYERNDHLETRVMPQLVKINDQGVVPCDTNDEMIREARQIHLRGKEYDDSSYRRFQ